MKSRPKSSPLNLVISSAAVGSSVWGENSHFVLSTKVKNKSNFISSLTLIDCGASAHGFIDSKFAHKHNFELTKLTRPRSLKVFDGTDSASGSITHLAKTVLYINGHTETILLFVTSLAYFDIVLGLPWLEHHSPNINWKEGKLTFIHANCQKHANNLPITVSSVSKGVIRERRENYINQKFRNSPITIEDCDVHTFEKSTTNTEHSVMAITIEDIQEALRDKPTPNPADKLPRIYHEFLRVFSKSEADKLPPHRPSDHRINLKPGSDPPWGPLYGMSRDELLVLKKYITENLEKGFIRPSSSPASSPVLFVKKPGGGLRLCIDYRALNELTIKNRYPIPRIHETLTLLGKAKYFTKLDVISAFNRIRIAKGDEHLTAFRTRFGLYEYLVMPFGLANAPSSFQNYINDTLRGYLDEFCTAYIDDILIFSETLEEHQVHVRKVLSRLLEAGLQIDIKKCEFHTKQVKFLGLILTTDGIKMDPAKLETIEKWPTPESTKDIYRFIGFVNFYRRFIKNFGSIVMPLTDLMKKDIIFTWTEREESAFRAIKKKFKEDVLLQHFNWDRPARLETDASDRGTGGVLLQPDITGVWKPVAFFSRKMSPAESNYEIYDKELLAIVQAFEEWRPELEGSIDSVEVITDHKALEYFMKSRLLSRRQARWSEFLSRFNFKICYRPGTQNGPADALSRPLGDPDPSLKKFLEQRILKPHNISPGMDKIELLAGEIQEINESDENPLQDKNEIGEEGDAEEITQPLLKCIMAKSLEDEEISKVVESLTSEKGSRVTKFTLAECSWDGKLLRYRGKIVVPQKLPDLTITTDIIRLHHDPPAAGHQGAAATYASVARTFFWHGMLQQVKKYVRNCHTCSRIKPSREGYQGLLRPLPVATERWKHIAMDFIVDLPRSSDWEGNEFSAMFVVVDRMTKQVHLTPCDNLTTRNAAYMFYRDCFRLHGLPDTIVSDRGSQFTAEFWKWLCKLLQIDHRLSTAFHPQTDGQTERMNSRIEQYLRAYVSFSQNDWVRYLPSAEFAMNNHDTNVTGISPFLAVYGLHPRSGSECSVNQPSRLAPASIQFERQDAEDLILNVKKVNKFLTDNIKFHLAEQEIQANRNRIAARNFKKGDLVWLNYKNIKSLRPCRKLEFKKGGPFKIIEKVGNYAFKLSLPNTVKIHPVFHVSLLSPVALDPLPGQISGPQPPLITESEEPEHEIEKIIGSQWIDNEIHYLVRWKGFGPEDDQAIPTSQASGFQELIKEFHELNPFEPKPGDTPPNPILMLKNKPRRSSARLRRG